MRIAIAEFKQETNTFVPRPTTFDDFVAWHFWTGDQVVTGSRDTNCEVAGFLDVLEAPAAGGVLPAQRARSFSANVKFAHAPPPSGCALLPPPPFELPMPAAASALPRLLLVF